jgi:hypothetical protein
MGGVEEGITMSWLTGTCCSIKHQVSGTALGGLLHPERQRALSDLAPYPCTPPPLPGPGCLVLSDALNHTSIVAGVRASGATVKVFRHNDTSHLEALLRFHIASGQPRTHRPWRKVCVVIVCVWGGGGDGVPDVQLGGRGWC